jgi:HK97 family phage major capsid protein
MADIFKALSGGTNSDGGFTVPDEFAARVLELITAKTVTVADLEQVSMMSDTMYIPKATTGTTAYIVPELGTITSSQQGFGRITLTPIKFAALVEASTELLEDSNVGMANIIVNDMARDLALKIDNEVLNGSAGSGFAGLRYTGSFTNSVAANGTISGTNGANISLTPISKAVDEILKDNHQMPDVSYWHPRTIGSLRLLTDSTSRPMFNQETWGSPLLREGVIGVLYGTAVKPTSQLPINLSYGTASADTTCADAILGKSKMFGLYGNRRSLTFNRDYAIDTDRNKYQANMRVAFSVKYPDAYCVIRAIRD